MYNKNNNNNNIIIQYNDLPQFTNELQIDYMYKCPNFSTLK